MKYTLRQEILTPKLNQYARHGNLYTIKKYGEDDFFPNVDGISMAVKFKHINILNYLETKGLLPTIKDANEAVLSRRIKVLDWMSTRGIQPNIE